MLTSKVAPIFEGSSTIVGITGKKSSLKGISPGVRPSESATERPLPGKGVPPDAGAVPPPTLGNLTVPIAVRIPGMICIDELHYGMIGVI
jgi:hypothetical protein